MLELRRSLLERFQSIGTVTELLELFKEGSSNHRLEDLDLEQLQIWLEGTNRARYYNTFYIAKRSGGHREISAPKLKLKTVQHIIAEALTENYKPRAPVHGYAKGRSIITNAKNHDGQRWILRVDLKDFFHTIHFGRVRGVLQAKPLNFNTDIANAVATLCTCPVSRYETVLPQGAPTSPIISNFVCRRLDADLMKVAKQYRCCYSRYADDLVFSTNNKTFPADLAVFDGITAQLGRVLREVIEGHDFSINEDKLSLRYRTTRHLVTGLVVNKKVNVPREKILEVKAMLHCWKHKGLSEAAQRFHEEYDKRYRPPGLQEPSFVRVVRGRVEFIGSVKGYADPVYLKLAKKLSELDSTYIFDKRNQHIATNKIVVFTEGKTDRMHLESALRFFKERDEFGNLRLSLHTEATTEGHDHLLTTCKVMSERLQTEVFIFLFDYDNSSIIQKVKGQNASYKDWGNNVFSLPLPPAPHRGDCDSFCIEHYFWKVDLIKRDEQGRRLYLRGEFDERTGKHKTEQVYRTNPQSKTLIVDTEVFGFESDNNVALSKSGFANAISNRTPPFDEVNFEAFRPLFEVLQEILNKVTFRE